MRTTLLMLILVLPACGGRPAGIVVDGSPEPPSAKPDRGVALADAAPPKQDSVCIRPKGSCHSDQECPANQVCAGCGQDPCCPMCNSCLGSCVALPKGPCATNADCPSGSFCEHDGLCAVTGGVAGTCKKLPICADTGACLGVCGCDGKTYCSSCDAHAAGVSVALAKACLAPTCAGLEGLYQAELKKAKTCCAMCAALQCVTKLPGSLHCGCDTFVNVLSPELTAIQAEFNARSCHLMMPPCGIKCAPPGPGFCGSDGLCIDGGD